MALTEIEKTYPKEVQQWILESERVFQSTDGRIRARCALREAYARYVPLRSSSRDAWAGALSELGSPQQLARDGEVEACRQYRSGARALLFTAAGFAAWFVIRLVLCAASGTLHQSPVPLLCLTLTAPGNDMVYAALLAVFALAGGIFLRMISRI